MSFTRNYSFGYSVNGSSRSLPITITSQLEALYDYTVANGQTDLAVPLAFDEDALKSIFITSDKAITIKTNSSGSPQETITLAANQVIFWDSSSSATKPVSDDVTSIFITNASGATATITIIVNHGTVS